MQNRCKRAGEWPSAVYSKPHFTVFEIFQHSSNQERLTNNLERISKNISPFKIELDGLDFFLNSTCTLYVKLKDEKNFTDMTKYIKSFSSRLLRPEKAHPSHYTTKNAHLTIVKGISKAEFLKASDDWKNEKYQSSTLAEHLLLLKRPFTTTLARYEVIGKYAFLGQGQMDAQTKLF